MAFANNYVVSVLVNDKPQREMNVNGKRSIQLPFDSEYKIRLKNQTNLRALVNIFIDGAPVFLGGRQLILEPKQSLDLERFVGELESGRKFKFVKQEKLGDAGHFDPTTSDLGKLSVEFVPEYVTRLGTITTTTHSQPQIVTQPLIFNQPSYQWWQNPQIFSSHVAINNSAIGGTIGVAGTQGNKGDKGLVSNNACSEISLNSSQMCTLADGGTVEGGLSDQSFTDSNSFVIWDYSKKTIIDIHMAGPSPLKMELTKSEQLARKFYTEFGGNYDTASKETQKALAFVVEKTILHTVLNK